MLLFVVVFIFVDSAIIVVNVIAVFVIAVVVIVAAVNFVVVVCGEVGAGGLLLFSFIAFVFC